MEDLKKISWDNLNEFKEKVNSCNNNLRIDLENTILNNSTNGYTSFDYTISRYRFQGITGLNPKCINFRLAEEILLTNLKTYLDSTEIQSEILDVLVTSEDCPSYKKLRVTL